MEITLWGVRGSYPAPGSHTVRYGGNTPCLEIQSGESRIILDAGTGIYPLGRQLAGQPAHHHIIFSHVHWDHIQGLPFFAPLYDPAVKVTVHAAPRFLPLLEELLTRDSWQIHLPIPRDQIRATVDLEAFHIGESFMLGSIEVGTVRLNHPYLCTGFRFRARGRSIVFYSDTAPFDHILFGYEYRPAPPRLDEPLGRYERNRLADMRGGVVELARGCDLLIHDAHFTAREYPRYAHFGHSTPDHALAVAREAEVQWLMLYHHAPTRSDAEVAHLETHYQSLASAEGLRLSAAREGQRITF